MILKRYFYRLLTSYLRIYARPGDKVLLVEPQEELIKTLGSDENVRFFNTNSPPDATLPEKQLGSLDSVRSWQPDYIILNGSLHYIGDIQKFLTTLHDTCNPEARLIVTSYNLLWRPLLLLATFLKLRRREPEANWISASDIENFALLSGYEPLQREKRVLLPLYIPGISAILNRFLAPLYAIRIFCMLNIFVLRPRFPQRHEKPLSVSVVVPARNEAGNIEDIFRRLPRMGPDDEVILIEGHSTDNTWEEINRCAELYKGKYQVKIDRQDGVGKADAVYKGFEMAEKDILMILDSDLTVPPEDLPKFYDALSNDLGEFINGSRLVYSMEKQAMRSLNILGNKFFAMAFSYVLGQQLKYTLCGTKVLRLKDWKKICANSDFFGDFDPFGDFDLLFGANRMGLKIIEIPVRYRARTYGDTNIDRWRHGFLLIKMLLFASRKLKFI